MLYDSLKKGGMDMKSCLKCGKVVADSTLSCPQCGSRAFNTEDHVEGVGWELLNQLSYKNPKAFWIIMAILGVLIIGGFIWFCSL